MFEDERAIFLSKHGFEPNLENPKTFSEKVICKKLFDRNPLITYTADKYLARNYIKSKIKEADNYLIPLLYAVGNPEDILFNRLPNEYIVKPNNACGRYIIVEKTISGKKYTVNYSLIIFYDLDKPSLVNICNGWLSHPYGVERYEWAYRDIKPLIIIEKLLKDNSGKIPKDYRFFMFDGKCKLISVTTPPPHIFCHYDENWNLVSIRKYNVKPIPEEKPACLNKMIEFAEILSRDFDFVRIDFFLVDGYMYFSEITHYPASGDLVFEPKEFDFELGSYWNVNRDNYNL